MPLERSLAAALLLYSCSGLAIRSALAPARIALAAKGRDQLTVSAFAGADGEALKRAVWAIQGAKVLAEDLVAGHTELLVEMGGRPGDAARLASLAEVQF